MDGFFGRALLVEVLVDTRQDGLSHNCISLHRWPVGSKTHNKESGAIHSQPIPT